MIVNLMQNNPSTAPTLARDNVFAAIMMVTNGIAGISILPGGLKHKELGFQPIGTGSLMAALTTLSGPTDSSAQLTFVSVFSLLIYFALVWAQTRSLKDEIQALPYRKFLTQIMPQL